MVKEQDNNNINTIYWVITVLPMVLMNLTPYIDFNLPETIKDDETYRQLVMGFSIAFVILVVAAFSSIKCFFNSETIVGKVFASLFLLLYLSLIGGMVYFYMSGYMG